MAKLHDINSNITENSEKEGFFKKENGTVELDLDSRRHKTEEEDNLGGPRFCPALYIQRYGFIREILDKHHVTSVVDYGCAECKIFTLIKTVPSLQTISLVDIDEKLLSSRQYFIAPQLCDFLQRRENPLHVQLLAGSAAMLDERIVGVEAVTLVEVIEHLTEDILAEVTHNIFSNIQPRMVIITTPNADFNVLFPDFSGFRHWDHKFEWTREQFKQWCDDICERYRYNVEIRGIGDPPPDNLHLGYCSQAAIFHSIATSRRTTQQTTRVYKLISEYHYPYNENKLSIKEQLDNEVYYYIKQQCSQQSLLDLNDQCETPLTIPVHDILNIKYVKNLNDPDFVREYLKDKYSLNEDESSLVIDIEEYIGGQTESSSDDDNVTMGDNSVQNQEIIQIFNEPEPDWI